MRTLRRRWWALLDDEQGMTLVEVIAAMFVLSIALMALAGVATSTLVQLQGSRDREQATNAASAAIEQVRARDFDAIVHAPEASLTGDSLVPKAIRDLLDVEGTQCRADEPLATGPEAEPVALRRSVNGFDVHVVITHSADVPPGCDAGSTGLKRVVAIASWHDRGDLHHVREQTLMTEVNRGLPVPEFSVDPTDANVELFADISRRCVRHTVRNEGTRDTYGWDLADASERAPTGTMTTADRAWEVTGYLVPDGESSEIDGFSDGLDTYRMTPPGGDSGAAPRGDAHLETGDRATLMLCYTPGPEADTIGSDDTPVWEGTSAAIEVRSMLDGRVTHDLEHALAAVVPQQLYLLEDDDANAHARCLPAGADDCVVSPMVMRAEEEIERNWAGMSEEPDSDRRLGMADFSDPNQSDWSTDMNLDGAATHPGLRLLPADTEDTVGVASRVRWRYQLTSDLDEVLLDAATIDVYLHQSDSGDGEPPDVALNAYLDTLDPLESTTTSLGQVTLDIADQESNPGEGWDRVGATVDLEGLSLDPGSYLQLRLECPAYREDPCDLAYDNEAYPAAVWLEARR